MNVKELPVVFECDGVQLIGVIHIPERPVAAGLITVAAGGIQYRAGCGRQLLSLARNLASQGIPVMRFDHRGMGDSVGDLLGFEEMEIDLQCAIDIFQKNIPELKHIVLYGGCEAASGIMISAWNLIGVKSVILANPWVNDSMSAAITSTHYIQRLRGAQFWKKLFSFQYSISEYAPIFFRYLKKKLWTLTAPSKKPSVVGQNVKVPFQERMLSGFKKFDGSVLFLKSGLSLISEEFDQLVDGSSAWSQACKRTTVSRVELPAADQTFSTAAARSEMSAAVKEWIAKMDSLHGLRDAQGNS
jgi:exosortase A-associated hydrolase 1